MQRAIVLLVVTVGLLGLATVAQGRSWSAPVTVDTSGTHQLGPVSCPDAHECSAVDDTGQDVTFDPTTGSASTAAVDRGIVPGGSVAIPALACPSTTQCTLVDVRGQAVTYDAATEKITATFTLAPRHALRGVACPSSAQCTAISDNGRALTFDPLTRKVLDKLTLGAELSSISCPSSGQCTAVTRGCGSPDDCAAPQALTFDPASTAAPIRAVVGSARDTMWALTCPSRVRCVAVGAPTNGHPVPSYLGGEAVAFNPQSSHAATPTGIGPSDDSGYLSAVACPATDLCVAAGSDGAVAFSPARPANHHLIATPGGDNGIACASASQCTVVGQSAEQTFDPAADSTGFQASLDTGGDLTSVSCPSVTVCAALDGVGMTTFAPGDPGGSRTNLHNGSFFPNDLTCPSTSECVAVGEDPEEGAEMTIDPGSPGTPEPVTVDPNQLVAVACPSAQKCVAADDFDGESVFDPTAPASAVTHQVLTSANDRWIVDIACPVSSQCTALTNQGSVLSFDPDSPAIQTPTPLASGSGNALACPETHECIAVVNGKVIAFDPASPDGHRTVATDRGGTPAAVACPSASDCVAVDFFGRALEGDPQTTEPWQVVTIPKVTALRAVSCPSPSTCVAVSASGQQTVGTARSALHTPAAAHRSTSVRHPAT